MSSKLTILIYFIISTSILKAQWVKTNLSSSKVSSVHFSNSNKLFAGTLDGLYYSKDYGKSWRMVQNGYGYTLSSIKTISSNPNGVIAASNGTDTFYSIDDGITWSKYPKGPSDANPDYANATAVLSDNTLLVCGILVKYQNSNWYYRSTDEGNTWKSISGLDGAVSMFEKSAGNYIYSLSYIQNHHEPGLIVYKIFRSSNFGETWTLIFSRSNSYSTNPTENIYSIGCQGNCVIVSSNLGLYRSTDHGDNWNKVDSSSIHINLTNFVQDTVGILYASNSHGIFISADSGLTWKLYDSTIIPTSMTVDNQNCLYAVTSNLGLYRNAPFPGNGENSSDTIPAKYLLEQNYPNPFNPTTTIEYQIPETTTVKIEIYDALGRIVKKFLNEKQAVGDYKIMFDGSRLSSGIYFYRITAGNYEQVKKMVLIK